MFVDNYLSAPGADYQGGIIQQMQGLRFDPGFRRPYIDKNGNPAVTVNTGRTTLVKGVQTPIKEHRLLRDLILNGQIPPVFNATALRKEEWINLDTQILRAARYRLRLVQDLNAAGLTFGGFNGMSKMILEHETMSDPGEAMVDMNGLSEGRGDAPKFQLEGLPLPITHGDFWFDSRTLAISRNSGTPLDTTMGEAVGRRIGETLEKTAIGNQVGITYGGNSTQVGGYGRTSSVYGCLNFSARLTKTNMTVPTGSNPEATVADVLAILDTMRLNKFYGPFMIYTSNDWDRFLDNDYARAVVGATSIATSKTLRQRLRDIDGITDVKRLDFLFATIPTSGAGSASRGPGTENLTSGGGGSNGGNPYTMIVVQMTPDVIRMVNGMDITTMQWESVGGMRVNFKVMCVQVPQLRADFYGNCGIMQATTA